MKGGRIPWVLLSLFALFLMMVHLGDTLYEADASENITRDIYNFTESKLVWNSTTVPVKEINTSQNYTEIRTTRISNIINKGADFIGYTFMETGKLGVEIGYNGKGRYDLMPILNAFKWLVYIIIAINLVIPIAVVVMLGWYSYDWIKKLIIRRRKNQ